MKPTEPKQKSPRALAREKRDEALMALGRAVYAEWREAGRPASHTAEAELRAVDDALAAVALQS